MNYLSNIYDKWINTKGLGAKVGIIDSGFDVQNIYLKDKIVQYYDYGSIDKDHGTHVFGIMALNANITGSFKGFAYESKYYLASVAMGHKNCIKYICESLQKMISNKVDVVNMSFTNYIENELMKQLLYQLDKTNTILVGAYSPYLLYPHSYPYVLSAGNQIITQESFHSCISNNQFKTIRGTSMQCAYISSVAAIAKAYDKKINKNMFIKIVSGNKMYKQKISNCYQTQFSLKLR